MSSHRLVFHPQVAADLDTITSHYREFDPALPQRFRQRLIASLAGLADYPLAHAEIVPGFRRIALKRFPYMAIYRVVGDVVQVVAVLHQHRDPEAIDAELTRRATTP